MSDNNALRSAGTVLGDGSRAKCENSSTSPLRTSTSPMMVAVHSSTSALARGGRTCQVATQAARRTAESGVSGFLDLVRQPARDIAPRGYALGPKQRCDVIEHHHDAIEVVLAWQAGGRHREVTLATIPRHRHFLDGIR